MSNFATRPKFDPNAPFEVEGNSAIDPGAVAESMRGNPRTPNAPSIQIGGPAPKFDPSQPFEEEGRSLGQEGVRQVGLAARYGVEGGLMPVAMLGDAANAAVNLGVEGINRVAGTKIPKLGTVSDAIQANLNRAGLPQPETGGERIVGEASRTLASVPAMAGAAAGTGARALRPLMENLGVQATSAAAAGGAYGGAKEAFPDSPIAQVAIGLAGGGAGALRAAENPQAAQRLADFARSGIRPSAQDVTQSPFLQRVSKVLEQIPFASGTIRARELERLAAAEAAAERATQRLGTPGTAQRMGEQIQGDVTRYRQGPRPEGMSDREIMTRPTRESSVAAKADVLYGRVPVADTAVMDMPNTTAALRDVSQRFSVQELNTLFATPLVQNVARILEQEGGRVPWRDLRNLRTELRYQQGQAAINPNVDARALGQLNQALTADILAGAEAAGPRALQAVQRADRYYAMAAQEAENSLQKIFRSNRPEEVWAQIESAISSKPNKADYAKLIALRRAVPRETWGDMAATITDGLGRPTSAGALPQGMPQFSGANFIRKFGDMSPEARTLLFDGAGRGDLRNSLEALNRALGNMKNTERMANPSNSGNQMIAGGVGAGALYDPATTAAGLALANVSARALYNPSFVRLMTQSLRVGGNDAVRQQRAIQVMNFMRDNPALRSDAESLLQSLVPVRADSTQQTNQGQRQ